MCRFSGANRNANGGEVIESNIGMLTAGKS